MTITAANVHTYYLNDLTIGGVSFAGAVGEAGAQFVVETTRLEINASNTLEVVKRLRSGRNARLEMPALENVLTLIATVIGDDTQGTDLDIPIHALSATIKDEDGTETALTGSVQFREDLNLNLDMKKGAELPIIADFVRTNGVLATLGSQTI